MQDVFTALASAGIPYQLPGPWQRFAAHTDFFTLPPDREVLLVSLRERFSDADLLSAGVVITDASGDLLFHKDLLLDSSPVWAIRAPGQQSVTTLVANMRPLGTDQTLLATMLQLTGMNDLIEASDGNLVVAYSMTDLAILHSLGIASILGADWTGISRSQFQQLCDMLNVLTSEQAQSSEIEPRWQPTNSLVLANWSLSELKLRNIAPALATWAHLAALHEALDVGIDDWVLWRPADDANLSKLRLQLQHLGLESIRKLVLSHIESYATILASANQAPKDAIQEFIFSLRAMHQAELKGCTGLEGIALEGSQAAKHSFLELHGELVVARLMAEAMNTDDPILRSKLVNFAQLSNLVTLELAKLTERMTRDWLRQSCVDSPDDLATIQMTMKLLASFRALMKEFDTWHKAIPRPSPIAPTNPSKVNPPKANPVHSNPWASGLPNSPH